MWTSYGGRTLRFSNNNNWHVHYQDGSTYCIFNSKAMWFNFHRGKGYKMCVDEAEAHPYKSAKIIPSIVPWNQIMFCELEITKKREYSGDDEEGD